MQTLRFNINGSNCEISVVKKIKQAGLIWAASIVCSCSAPSHIEHTPELNMPDYWQSPVTEQNVSDKSYHEFNAFVLSLSPTIAPLIGEVLSNNLDIHIAEARLRESKARFAVASSSRWPSLNFKMGTQERTQTHSASFTSTWEADVWGRVRDGALASKMAYSKESFVYRRARESVVANVVLYWLSALEQHQLYLYAEQNLAIQNQRLVHLERRLDQGLADVLDVRLLRNNVANLNARLLLLEQNHKNALRRIEVLLGRYPRAEEMLFPSEFSLSEFQVANTPRTLLENRPDVVAQEYALISANLSVREARKKLLPKLTLSATYSNGEDQPEHLFDFDRWLQNFSVGLLQPLFQGGALKAGLKQKQAQAEMLLATYKKTVLRAWQEVEEALYAEYLGERRVTALQRALTEALGAEALTLRKYGQGLVTSFELLSAQNRSITAQTELIRARIGRVENRVKLYLSLGQVSLPAAQ